MVFVPAFLSFVITVVFLFALRPLAVAVGLVDVPGGRKRHDVPVPVIGGIAMSIGLGVGTSLAPHPVSWTPTMLGVYLLVVVGTIDDRFDLPANVRLVAQSCAALLVVLASGVVISSLGDPLFFPLGLGHFSLPFTVLFVITIVNAFNLIDGIDGLAGGLALLSLIALAVIGIGTPTFGVTVICGSTVAAYLIFNLPLGFNRPVRTFMGDAGSTTLGLIVATIGILSSQGPTPRITPVTGLWLVAVPVFDLFSAIVRRVLASKSPFAPDDSHLHHVLTASGLSHRKTLVVLLALATAFAFIGLIGDMLLIPEGVMLPLWVIAGVLYYQLMRHAGPVVRLARRFLPATSEVIPAAVEVDSGARRAE